MLKLAALVITLAVSATALAGRPGDVRNDDGRYNPPSTESLQARPGGV